MLTEEKNARLTKVGPGSEMGEYLRRYWHPIAGESEFVENAIKSIRIMGEDLVLFKDLSGNFGVVDRHCPHRSADMLYGYVEETGIRCSYHGWRFDQTGQCVEQPFEQVCDPTSRMCKRIKIKAYRIKAKAGLLWIYMGPEPVPELPDWDLFNYKNGYAQAVFAELPCNWLQCQENSIDPVHFEWTHNNWSIRQSGVKGPYVPTHLKLEFDEFEYGFTYRRLRGQEDENNPMWTVGRVTLWPNGFYLGHHFEWRVPVDDENTLSVLWIFCRVPTEQEPYQQKKIPSWYGPIRDSVTGRWITSHVANQDFVVWVGQGAITDRSRENLGQSDRGIVMLRRRFFDELDQLKNNPNFVPKALIFDQGINKDIVLPSACRDELINGLPRKELGEHPLLGPYLKDFFGQAGQPDEVRTEYEEAVGQKMEGAEFFAVHGSSGK